MEGAAAARSRIHPDAAAVRVDDSLDRGQPQTEAPGLFSQSESVLNACLIWEIPADSCFSKVAALSLDIPLFSRS